MQLYTLAHWDVVDFGKWILNAVVLYFAENVLDTMHFNLNTNTAVKSKVFFICMVLAIFAQMMWPN